MSLATLPAETLQDILGHLCDGFANLRNCSLVCKSLYNASVTALYKDIDLTIDTRGNIEDRSKSRCRQLTLLHSLAVNPKLGASVRRFRTFRDDWNMVGDPNLEFDGLMALYTARNMFNICEATLTPNEISAFIVDNLQLYPQLTDLYIRDYDPKVHIWSNAPVSLTRIRWDVPDDDVDDPWPTAHYLQRVAAATCPKLQSLEIRFRQVHMVDARIYPDGQACERALLYERSADDSPPRLLQLRHFGIYFVGFFTSGRIDIRGRLLLDFLRLHQESLKSLSVSSDQFTDLVPDLCGILPNLENLSIAGGTANTSLCPPYSLTKRLASPQFSIKSLDIQNIGTAFSSDIGKLFRGCNELEVLTVGDEDMEDGPYDDDGRPDFEAYRPNLLGFIQDLPPSLKELHIEIRGGDLSVNKDEDFDPICDMGSEIFSSLPRLNTCDVHAWISSNDLGLGRYPDKAICYRRMKHQRDTPESAENASFPDDRIKDIWATRMACVYLSPLTIITKALEVCRLNEEEGVFLGADATELWQGGYTFEYKEEETGTGQDSGLPHFIWPFSQDKFANYPRFRSRHF